MSRDSAGAVRVGVVGASGYAGLEILRLCAGHPTFEVAVACAGSHAGESVAELAPSLAGVYPELVLAPTSTEALSGLDLVFSALPHGESQKLVPDLLGDVGCIVDLAADFRLPSGTYEDWYGEVHGAPDVLDSAVYGLPELSREGLPGARLIAAAGCYPTAAILALRPFVAGGFVEPTGIVVDAASGVSGAGRGLSDRLHFGSVDANFSAYGLVNHRHTPEIEQGLGSASEVLFTPHLAPMSRGILATCYARVRHEFDPAEVLSEAYEGESFVTVVEGSPSTKSTLGSNSAHVSAVVDPRTGWLVALCALDNLVKGAAGQAIQCANIALGLDEGAGLPVAGVWP